MEEVLELYTLPYDPDYPLVCMDETNKQLLSDKHYANIALKPGQVEREDYQYRQGEINNLFMFFEPLQDWRHVMIKGRRTQQDWAECIKTLLDEYYPKAKKVRLVLDNLNTHLKGSLYERYAPNEAKRLCDGLELHYTPKHGSWLNMAEIELSTLSRQCLDRRIGQSEILSQEVKAWEEMRNAHKGRVKWRFTTTEARIKLVKLYPSNGL
jgi:hypothetical protein